MQGRRRLLKPYMIVAASLLLSSSPALSRQWRATPDAVARDYSQIIDARGRGEVVILTWMAPQTIPLDNPSATTLRAMLQQYVIVLVVHSQLDKATGVVSFRDSDPVSLRDQTGRSLSPVARDSLPPTNIAVITAMEAVFRQSLGAMGAGMKAFIFGGAGVDDCSKGQVIAQFADETYSWDTPFPGCSPKN